MIEVQNPREQFGQNKMLPPPVGTFQTPEELLKHIQDFVLTQGYMVSIKDFSKDRYVIIACEGGGVYHKRLKCGDNMHEQKAPSRLTNCPFEVVGKKDNDLWKLTIEHGEHNHEPSENMSDQLSSRCFTEEEVLVIREMTAAGKQPNKILKVLRQRNPNLMSDPRIVYSVKAMIRREMSSGKKMESPPSSGVFNMNGVMGLEAPSEQMVANGTAMGGSIDQAYIESDTVKETRALASDLCRQFYKLGWLSGTGGSITIKVHDDLIPKSRQLIVMSPSGVQKEMMFPEDFYVCFSDGFILSTPLLKPYPHSPPTCTDCAPLFMKAYEMRNSGAVIHSHGMASCLVTMINPFSKEFKISHMEMIKGIQGHGYHDELVVPIIENTAHERELIGSFTEAIKAYPKATAVLVRNHGVFIWGDSWISTKTQAECYHYIFYAAIKLHQLGLDWSTPNHSCVCSVTRTRECGGNVGRDLKTGALGIDYAIEHKHRFILLDMEGTTTPTSFTTDVLFPYANNKFLKHLEAAYDCEDTHHDISLLRWQAIIRTDREVTALEQLQGLISKSGFARKELAGVVFDDVSVALQRWNALGVKVYIRSTSSSSREADQLLLANSTYGDLRKYICGYFDTTIGSQKDSKSYVEILQTVGVDRASDILFVTATLQEADAARAAGLEVMISIRPGNEPLPENHGFKVIESFLTI